ncbi:MAG: hypothetical protein Q4C25_01150 [Bacillota bacterium]|nr:hypothetical protein [Bacillota bacterium]
MKIIQFVMAYGVDHDRLRSILPKGFTSLRPVLRINAEIRDGKTGYVEFNTAVETDDKKGWLNIGFWEDVPFTEDGQTVTFESDFLKIRFTRVGVEGSCPAEKDNDGCYFLDANPKLRLPENVTASKEFCDCEFAWHFEYKDENTGAHGVSTGKTLPAVPTKPQHEYPRQAFTVENAATIPCQQVLGSYMVEFKR